MLDILKSEGNFVIKFVALTLKLYLCIAIISKESHKRIIMGVFRIIHAYSSDHLIVCKRKLRCPRVPGARAASLRTNTQWDHKCLIIVKGEENGGN